MPLTKEQLLLDRVKVVSDYPDSIYKIGDIIVYSREVAQSYDEWHNTRTGEKFFKNPGFFRRYPSIFQSLPWWSDRKIEDMPEYMESDDSIYKITYFNNCQFDCNDGNGAWYINEKVMCHFEPATEQEYLAYINQKTTIMTPKNKPAH